MSHLRQGQRALLFEDVDFVGRVTENFHVYCKERYKNIQGNKNAMNGIKHQ